MGTGGLSRAWLAHMHDFMASYVERGEVSGLFPGFFDRMGWGLACP